MLVEWVVHLYYVVPLFLFLFYILKIQRWSSSIDDKRNPTRGDCHIQIYLSSIQHKKKLNFKKKFKKKLEPLKVCSLFIEIFHMGSGFLGSIVTTTEPCRVDFENHPMIDEWNRNLNCSLSSSGGYIELVRDNPTDGFRRPSNNICLILVIVPILVHIESIGL